VLTQSKLKREGRDTRDIWEISLLCMSEIVVFCHRKSPKVHTDIGHTEADRRLENVFNQKNQITQIFFY